jgi:hypothetical protein
MVASQAKGTNTNHVNLHLLDVILYIYVLNSIISFRSFTISCYTPEEIDKFLHISGNENARIWVLLPCHKDCK